MNDSVIHLENLYKAWRKFKKGKQQRKDVEQAEFSIERILVEIRDSLQSGTYSHQPYIKFIVCDPKERIVHKAVVFDRIIHQYAVDELFASSEKVFIRDTYACRKWKGLHVAVKRLEYFVRSATGNGRKAIWYLKCDIRKFFDSIDHDILLKKLEPISSPDTFNLVRIIVASFSKQPGKGLPLGNVTSQLFANLYLNDFDHFMKHFRGIRHYIRYADDFVILHEDRHFLETLVSEIRIFLWDNARLTLHPNKITLKKVSQGIDFLGYVVFPRYTRIRHKTKRRIEAKMLQSGTKETLESYKGFIMHAKSFKIRRKLERLYEVRRLTSSN